MVQRMSRLFPVTRRESSKNYSGSHSLLIQAGFIRSAGTAGIFHILPLGWKVHEKIRWIVYDEMEKNGVLNMQMPVLQPQSVWETTGRWEKMRATKTLYTTSDPRNSTVGYAISPTAEEVITALAAAEISTWRQLPVTLHQVGIKCRAEIRPHSGLLRCREFEMSDAYSFDADATGMRSSFDLFSEVIYPNIFKRIGVEDLVRVQADSGQIGGEGSSEFMIPVEIGEDVLLVCSKCSYGANQEKARGIYESHEFPTALEPIEKVATPTTRTVAELINLFHGEIPEWRMVKTILYVADPDTCRSRVVAVCIRADLDIQETKLQNITGTSEIRFANKTEVQGFTRAEVGFVGPVGLDKIDKIYFDQSTQEVTNFLCGGNESGYHYINVNFGRDLPAPDKFFDLAAAKEGYHCPTCQAGTLSECRGIEIGHTFMLQRVYSDKLGVKYTDKKGALQPVWMGCYGIGTTRLMQALVEQHHDDDGIVWPESVAPYNVHLLVAKATAEAEQLANQIATRLSEVGIDVLYDDRHDLQAGVKFKDADLIGISWRVAVGRKAQEGIVELRNRRSKKSEELTLDILVSRFSK